MISGKELGNAARKTFREFEGKRIRKVGGGDTPNGFDCGGFVEYCFRQCGEPLQIKGTNDLFRREHHWRGTLETARKEKRIHDGSLAFIVEKDGGERKRGYHDGLGNAVCVGIVSDNQIIYYSGDNEEIRAVRINSTTRKNWWSHFMNIRIVDY